MASSSPHVLRRLLLSALVLGLSSPTIASADGEPDLAFGTDGIARGTIAIPLAEAAGMTVTENGRIVLVGHGPGTTGNDVVVLRLLADGAPDPSFGDEGVVVVHAGGDDRAAGVALQSDGKVVVVGSRIQGATVEFLVIRLRTDGTLDSTFNSTGRRVLDFGSGATSTGAALALQHDGKIVVAGTRTNASGSVFAVARLRSDGSFDTSFAGNGKRVVDFGISNGNDAFASAVAIQDDGSVVVAGSLEGDQTTSFALTRLLPDGEPDAGFDSNGKVVTSFGPAARAAAIAIAPNGRIVVAGTRFGAQDADFAVAMYRSDGKPATSFGGNGKRTTDFSRDENATAVTVRADGRIVVAGSRSGPDGSDFAVARYRPDGSPDDELDGDGKLRIDLFPDLASEDEAIGVASLADGKFVVGGTTRADAVTDFAATRRLASFEPPRGVIEIPGTNSAQSGVGLISGWLCDADDVTLYIDGEGPVPAAYGTARNDTRAQCGDSNNGFSILFNWGLLGDGTHVIRALADGTEFGRTVFRVATLGVSFLRDASGSFELPGFPTADGTTTVAWTEAAQRFVVMPPGAGAAGAAPVGNPAEPASGDRPAATLGQLENPPPDSFQSGVGVISGWICSARAVTVRIDGGPPQRAGYGTSRNDTESVCGDADNGFGVLLNYGLLGDGEHEVVVLADGTPIGSSRFTVTTFGVPFLRNASGRFTLSDFPESGDEVDLEWVEGQQGFVITGARR